MDKAENERELVTGTSSESDSDDTESEDNVTDSESSNTSEKEPVSEIFKQAHQTSDNEEAQEQPAHVTNLLRKVAAYKTELHQFSRFGSSAKQLEFLSTQPLQYKKCIPHASQCTAKRSQQSGWIMTGYMDVYSTSTWARS